MRNPLRTLFYPLIALTAAVRKIIHTEPRPLVRRTVLVLILPIYAPIALLFLTLCLLTAAITGLVEAVEQEWYDRAPGEIIDAIIDRWNGVGIRKAIASHPCATCTCLTADECRIR